MWAKLSHRSIFVRKPGLRSWCCRHNARIGPSWLIALLVEEDNNSKLEWPRERWVCGWIRSRRGALWRGAKTCSPKWDRVFLEMNAWKLARRRERASACIKSVCSSGDDDARRHLFYVVFERCRGKKIQLRMSERWQAADAKKRRQRAARTNLINAAAMFLPCLWTHSEQGWQI
jgi:hypothetical protein